MTNQTTDNKKQLSEVAQAAAQIRKVLKANEYCKDTKFSVRSESFAGGNSINVRWVNGPTEDQVEDLIGQYQYGYFDGMTDSYEYSNNRKDIPQTKYLHLSRKTEGNKYDQYSRTDWRQLWADDNFAAVLYSEYSKDGLALHIVLTDNNGDITKSRHYDFSEAMDEWNRVINHHLAKQESK